MPSKAIVEPTFQSEVKMYSQLKIDNENGIIFSSSITPISGSANIELKNKLEYYEILISDKNSNEILRKSLKSDESNSSLETSFTWDLKSKSNSYVKSGCYTVSLIDTSNELEKIECCSLKCRVVDTRNILSITRSLKHSHMTTNNQALLSVYSEIIEDIEYLILERLRNNRFEEPYFVACITASFVQEIADDIQDQTRSHFLDRIAEFQSKHPMSEEQMRTARLGLWTIFDFLVNYMSDLEDHARANAMAKCGQGHLTQNDKAQIVSSLVLGIYPHCKIIFPKNVIGSIIGKIFESMIKFGIKYLCTRHINKSISISETLPLGNPCDVVIR
jgi:hypothetical protein